MTDTSNPWITREPEEPAPVVIHDDGTPLTGPTRPQLGVPSPTEALLLPVRPEEPRRLWILGTHGGAGESTIASLDPAWSAAGHSWPRHHDHSDVSAVLCARTNYGGLISAQTAATQWAAGLVPHVELIGLVLIADAPGRLPRPLRDLASVVVGGVPRTWSVPWIEDWRRGGSPDSVAVPGAVRRLVDELHTLTPGAAGAP